MKRCLSSPLLAALLCVLLPGCAGDGVAGRALAVAGIGKSARQAEANKPPRNVAVRLHAAPKLNLDAQGRPLAVLARVYHLRQRAAFEAAPYAAFLSPGADREAFGADLVEVREVTLVPGQRYEVTDKVAREAGYIGVVALFHSPAAGRWRLAFDAPAAEKAGLTVGLQACALSVGPGARAATPNVNVTASGRCQ